MFGIYWLKQMFKLWFMSRSRELNSYKYAYLHEKRHNKRLFFFSSHINTNAQCFEFKMRYGYAPARPHQLVQNRHHWVGRLYWRLFTREHLPMMSARNHWKHIMWCVCPRRPLDLLWISNVSDFIYVAHKNARDLMVREIFVYKIHARGWLMIAKSRQS